MGFHWEVGDDFTPRVPIVPYDAAVEPELTGAVTRVLYFVST
jgi:hypothetical protein